VLDKWGWVGEVLEYCAKSELHPASAGLEMLEGSRFVPLQFCQSAAGGSREPPTMRFVYPSLGHNFPHLSTQGGFHTLGYSREPPVVTFSGKPRDRTNIESF
jgi:hypothetical protein